MNIDSSAFAARELIEKLSRAATTDPALSKELGNSAISLKPSFYLMIVSPTTSSANEYSELARQARQTSGILFDRINARLEEASSPPLREFQVIEVSKRSSGVVEWQVAWHQLMRYWSTNAVLEHLYTLRLGFVFVDFNTNKALICCHTIQERDVITEALEQKMPIRFTPITLTKDLLERIGTFDRVKRAGYFVTNPGTDETEEVMYSDEQLAAKPNVRAQENNPKYFRKHSFYRVDLGGLSETGLGVTADTAKLWIPAETAIGNVRDYGLLLLKKFTATLNKMKQDGDVPGILKVLTLQDSHVLGAVPGGELRTEIVGLCHELVQMLLNEETERPYTPPSVFLTRAIPRWFNPPRLQLVDESTESVAYWSDLQKQTEFVSFSLEGGDWHARAYPSGQMLALDALPHPLTGNPVNLTNPPRAVELWPTLQLHEVLLGAVKQISSQLPRLKKIVALPFYIQAGRIVINQAMAKSHDFAVSLRSEVDVASISQFQQILQHHIPLGRGVQLGTQLNRLGEKCAHMTDPNCESCLESRRFLCLRSLLARYMSHHMLLMHKGIELSDLQGTLRASGANMKVWVFSKLATGKSGLTLRNMNGAILLAQIIAQLDKDTFDTVAVLSPSTINEDLRERLIFLAGLVGKRVIIVSRPILEKMLAHFEEQTRFDKKDPKRVYAASRSKKARGRELEAAGSLV